MTDWPEWLKGEASKAAEDQSFRLYQIMAWAATLLIAVDAPLEERIHLMEMADAVMDCSPPLQFEHSNDCGSANTFNSDRMASIHNIESMFLELCRRNSIAPEERVPAELLERVQEVLSNRKKVTDPLRLSAKGLREKIDQIKKSIAIAQGANMTASIKEWQCLAEEYCRLMDNIRNIHYLGTDKVNM